jgi:tetratricopeptide (TPR) repeat protein
MASGRGRDTGSQSDAEIISSAYLITDSTESLETPWQTVDADSVEVVVDGASVDNLLAAAENMLPIGNEAWDINKEVRVLQAAAAPGARTVVEGRGDRRGGISLPTAYDLAPGHAPPAEGNPSAVPPPSPSRPPPLPATGRGVSKPPPPISRRPPSPTINARSADGSGPHPASTGSHPPPVPVGSRRPPANVDQTGSTGRRSPQEILRPESLVELLLARIAVLEASTQGPAQPGAQAARVIADRVGLGRVQIEMSAACEILLADDTRAISHAEAALRVDPKLSAAHATLRRKQHGRSALPVMLEHLENELSASTEEATTVELLVEKARLLEARGDNPEIIRQIWQQALARSPHHAAALKGLEAELTRRVRVAEQSLGASASRANAPAYEALAEHLGRMADAYVSDPHLAAWLHVERAHILEWNLRRVEAARGALERAVGLDASVGPVRDEAVRHVAAHDNASALAALLEEEAQIENDGHRAARLELDAACIVEQRLGDPQRAIVLLTRAAERAPTASYVDRRVLDELTRLHERIGEWPHAARARRARLRFLADPLVLAFELRTLARIDERLGQFDSAIEHTRAALNIDPDDAIVLEALDRLLATTGMHEQRIALWVNESQRVEDGPKRARALTKAAQIAEANLEKRGEALEHLRAAWVASPGDAETLDALSRMLAPPPSEAADHDARALVDLYAQAVDTTADEGRRVAYLEKIALLWEEVIGDVRRAARAYEEILRIEPGRRGAVLGLSRTARRMGDDRLYARALMEEANLAEDAALFLSLQVRAATALAAVDPERALSLVDEVLHRNPNHPPARVLETRLHEEAGRWERACDSLRARILLARESATDSTREAVDLWLELAKIQNLHLRSPEEALESFKAARSMDPNHPVPPEEIIRMLEAVGDYTALRNAMESMANDSTGLEDRARFLMRAAEIDELRLRDDARAAVTYARALAETPDDELIAERLERVIVRRAATAADIDPGSPGVTSGMEALIELQEKRLEAAAAGHLPTESRLAFDVAKLKFRTGRDATRASQLLESVLERDPGHVPALRTLESVGRKSEDFTGLAHALSGQGRAYQDVAAKLGALWNLVSLEEWRLPVSDPGLTYRRILELHPNEPSALEAMFRRELPSARRGERKARDEVTYALRSLLPMAADDGMRLSIELKLALLLEATANDTGDASQLGVLKESLDRYRGALRVDPLSLTAATGLARIAPRLHDVEASVAAAIALADLSGHARARARYLIDAAELLLGPEVDDVLGSTEGRRWRAGELLEKALDADADSIAAAARLSTVRREEGNAERIVEIFRDALKRATKIDAIVHLGAEIARVARDVLADLPLAIDAMRRVREAAPQHIPSLLTLAELCMAQRSWPEAVDALEAVVRLGRDAEHKLTALFALSSIHEHVLGKPQDAERALRLALDIDPNNPRALRGVLRHVTALHTHRNESGESTDPIALMDDDTRDEVASLMERLSRVVEDADERCDFMLKLADIRLRLGDAPAAERALVEAVAQTPASAKAFDRLANHFRTPKGRDHLAYARALNAVIKRGRELGFVDAQWYAHLGRLEIEALGRLRDGISHLQKAVQADPSMHEIRFELARAFVRASSNEDASRQLLGMLDPNPMPLLSLKQPCAALGLLEQALGGERRTEEALVVSELRAIAGDLDEGRHAWLRSRRLGPIDTHHTQLDRPSIVTHVLPVEARHVLLEVAAAVAGIESRILRADLTELGISPRDRISARTGHPTRMLLDRLQRILGLTDIELVVCNTVPRTRVLAQDTLWVVMPHALTELPEPAQLAALGRALTRISLGVPWLEELPPPHIEAFLIAAARQVVHGYAADDLDVLSQKLVAQYEPNVARVLSRKQKKLLEELAPHISAPQGRPIPIDAFVSSLARTEMRAAAILTGDLLATIDEMRAIDPTLLHATERPGVPALKAVLEHAFAGDLVRFALSGEAIALRRRIGSVWTA